MKAALTIAKKDFCSYFHSPIAYIVMTVFSFIMGYMFISFLNMFKLQSMQFEQFQMGRGLSVTDNLIRPTWGNMNLILLFIVPFITMRLFAEERRQNTLEFLLTAPVRLSDVVLGKFLSALGFVLVLLALTFPYPIALYLAVKPDLVVMATCYLGTVCMIGVYVAVGVLCSAFTENQIIAGALTFGIILFFWIIKWASYSGAGMGAEFLNYLSIIDHFEDFSRGVLNTKDIVFYLSAIGLWLFLTYKVLESYTWRA